MFPNWLGIISAILAIFTFYLAFQSGEKMSARNRWGVTLVACFLAVPGISFTTYYAHILPEPAWYYQFRSLPGMELLVIPIGIAGGLVASILPRGILFIPLLGVAFFSFVPIAKPLIGPFQDGVFSHQWDGDICLQSAASTCGAATTATILKRFGKDASEKEIAREAHSYRGGTEAWYLARCVRSRGLRANFDFASGFNPEASLPAMVGVRFGSIGHFIPILERQGDQFVIGDPLRGPELLSEEKLLKRYEFTGFHMTVPEDGGG